MTDQKQKQLRARVALSFYEVYGRRPTPAELEQHVNQARLYSHAILSAFFERQTHNQSLRQP
jgi:hypothetical protein